jgi:four helix bundle protein
MDKARLLHALWSMNEQAEALKRRTKQFALDVIALVRTFPAGEPAWTVRNQLTDAATSVGANYRAACRARSRAEFVAKIGVVEEEADESGFWLEISQETRLARADAIDPLLKEADELTAIFARSTLTARRRLNC